MSGMGVGVSIALAVLCGSTSALADWSFTRWGMSPREVVRKSKSEVFLYDGHRAGGTVGPVERARGTVKLGNISVAAKFYFEAEKLSLIKLESASTEVCESIVLGLNGKYGMPIRAGRELSIDAAWAEWRSDANNLTVRLDNGSSGCAVQYEPLITAEGAGL